jgi:hypothetical protein
MFDKTELDRKRDGSKESKKRENRESNKSGEGKTE